MTRWVEVFTEELFNNYWEPVRLDASLTYNDTLNITAMTTEVVPNNAMYDDAGNLMFDSSGEIMTD